MSFIIEHAKFQTPQELIDVVKRHGKVMQNAEPLGITWA